MARKKRRKSRRRVKRRRNPTTRLKGDSKWFTRGGVHRFSRCKAITKAGKQCRNIATIESLEYFTHGPRRRKITKKRPSESYLEALKRRRIGAKIKRSDLCRMHTTMKKEGKRVVRRKTRRKTRRRAKRRTRRSRRRTKRRRRRRAR